MSAPHEATGSLPLQAPYRLESERESSADLEDARAAEAKNGIGLVGRRGEAVVDASAEVAPVRDVEDIIKLSDQFQLKSLRDDVELLGETNIVRLEGIAEAVDIRRYLGELREYSAAQRGLARKLRIILIYQPTQV